MAIWNFQMATLYFTIEVILPLHPLGSQEVNISKILRSVPINWTAINYNKANRAVDCKSKYKKTA